MSEEKIDPNVNGYRPLNSIPGPFRKMFDWIARATGLSLYGGIPQFRRGLKIGGVLITEETARTLVELVESPVKRK